MIEDTGMIYWPNQFFTSAKVVWYGLNFTTLFLLYCFKYDTNMQRIIDEAAMSAAAFRAPMGGDA